MQQCLEATKVPVMLYNTTRRMIHINKLKKNNLLSSIFIFIFINEPLQVPFQNLPVELCLIECIQPSILLRRKLINT